MTIQYLAIVGKLNEPLYLCDCSFPEKNAEISEDEQAKDIFGFSTLAATKGPEDSIPLQKEFLMHAALDHLEEALGVHPGLPSRRQTGSHWLGFLCQMEDSSVYAYATTTNIKLIAFVESPAETYIKAFFKEIHDLYVKYTMNPFTKIQGRVTSKKFDEGIRAAVKTYKENSRPRLSKD